MRLKARLRTIEARRHPDIRAAEIAEDAKTFTARIEAMAQRQRELGADPIAGDDAARASEALGACINEVKR